MDYTTVGLSHHTAEIELRERLAVGTERQRQAYELLVAAGAEAMLISTCNRVEVISHGLGDEAVPVSVDVLSRVSGVEPAAFQPALRVFRGRDAVRHAFRTASGLDSMVLGEPQVQGQFKAAFQLATEAGAAGSYLVRLGQRTLQVAKRVRTETEIGRFAVNLSSLAVELSEQIFDPLATKQVLVLGAGEMAELAVTHFVAKGITNLAVLNRTRARAEELAARVELARAGDWEAWPAELAAADVILMGAGGEGRLLGTEEVRRALRHAPRRPRLIIDLAVPRAVDPAVGKLSDMFLYSVDDLEALSRGNLERRLKEAARAEVLIGEAVDRFASWYGEQKLSPALGELNRWLEATRLAEVERTLGSAGERGAEELVEAATSAVVRRIVQRVAHRLKAGPPGAGADLIQRLIDPSDPSESTDAPDDDEERHEAPDRLP